MNWATSRSQSPVVRGRSYMFVPQSIGAAHSLPVTTQPRPWYAVYTRARHEKRVAEQLTERSVEFFLPLCRSFHCWNDRSRLVELPLLPGYLFVRIAVKDRLLVLQIPSVVRLLSFQGHPVALPDCEVERIHQALLTNVRMEPHPYLKLGSCVRIKRGPFEGAEGIVVRSKNIFRVVISLDLLLRSIAVELDAADLERIPGSPSDRNGVASRGGGCVE